MEAQKPSKLSKIIVGVVWIIAPLPLGLLSSLLAGNAMRLFASMDKPPFAPPAWLFPIAWTILYLLMGLAAYLIFVKSPTTRDARYSRRVALGCFCAQLLFNILWTPIFFLFGNYWLAFACLLIMWLLIIFTMTEARRVSVLAFWLLLPYLLWSTFAAYLNIGVAILN